MMRWVLMIFGCMASDAWSANQVVWYPKARTFDLMGEGCAVGGVFGDGQSRDWLGG